MRLFIFYYTIAIFYPLVIEKKQILANFCIYMYVTGSNSMDLETRLWFCCQKTYEAENLSNN